MKQRRGLTTVRSEVHVYKIERVNVRHAFRNLSHDIPNFLCLFQRRVEDREGGLS